MTDTSCRQKVLIVDDSPEDILLLMECLCDEYATVVALNGENALCQAETEPRPDIILMDIRMPGMDGYEVCARFKDNPRLREMPVIFLSSLESSEDKVKAFQSGGVDYITKPFQAAEVQARVRTHLMLRNFRLLLEDQNRNLEQIVAERTSELANAYERLAILDSIKGDFLLMISHEVRTPLNGILGISDLVFELCPPSDARNEFRRYYWQSRQRMEQLLDDALLLNTLESSSSDLNCVFIRFGHVLAEAVSSIKDIVVTIEQGEDHANPLICCDRDLIKRALAILIRLASCFTSAGDRVRLSPTLKAGTLVLVVPLDCLTIAETDLGGFFELASNIRGNSAAQGMGLAPVVAERIVTLFGGTVRLAKESEKNGILSLTLPLVSSA